MYIYFYFFVITAKWDFDQSPTVGLSIYEIMLKFGKFIKAYFMMR